MNNLGSLFYIQFDDASIGGHFPLTILLSSCRVENITLPPSGSVIGAPVFRAMNSFTIQDSRFVNASAPLIYNFIGTPSFVMKNTWVQDVIGTIFFFAVNGNILIDNCTFSGKWGTQVLVMATSNVRANISNCIFDGTSNPSVTSPIFWQTLDSNTPTNSNLDVYNTIFRGYTTTGTYVNRNFAEIYR